MKKLIVLLLALVMALSLVACGGGAAAEPADDGETAPVEQPAPAEELVTDGVTFTIPEGFEESALEGTDLCYKAADNSNITVMSAEKDPNFASVSKEALEEYVKSTLEGVYDAEIQIVTNDFNFFELDGVPAYFWDVSIALGQTEMRELLIGINADYSYAVTYTDASSDLSHLDSFYESAGTITLNRVAA